MKFVITWKVVSLISTGAFGVLGLLKEFKNKETNGITKWGWVSLVGIVLSAGFGVTAQLIEFSDQEKSRQATATQTLALAKKTDQTVRDIQRALSPLDEPRFNLGLRVPCDYPKYQAFCLATKAMFKKKPELLFRSPLVWDRWPSDRVELTLIIRFFVDPKDAQEFIDNIRYVSFFHEPMLPDFQMFIHGSANEKTMAVSLHPVGPSGAGEDQTFIVLESVAGPTSTRSNGRIKSVLDLANTTVLITDADYVLPSESVLNELFLDSLYMKLRNGHEVHIDLSHVERFTAQGRPVYRYVFPATQD